MIAFELEIKYENLSPFYVILFSESAKKVLQLAEQCYGTDSKKKILRYEPVNSDLRLISFNVISIMTKEEK